MRCPNLNELPPPPSGKTGWPWSEQRASCPTTRSNGLAWPKVTIVTPSYNQGDFIEETIRSVLLQGYPDLEYIIIDGGSADCTLEVVRKYEPWITYWVSESDKGQADAINKGFRNSTGEILAWLNSDDVYEPDAVPFIAKYFAETPECDLLYGNGWYTDEEGNKTNPCFWITQYDRRLLLTFNFILQPAASWRRTLWKRTGGLNPNLHWAMDWEWLLRATALVQPHYVRRDLACWRIRPNIKPMSGGWARRAE